MTTAGGRGAAGSTSSCRRSATPSGWETCGASPTSATRTAAVRRTNQRNNLQCSTKQWWCPLIKGCPLIRTNTGSMTRGGVKYTVKYKYKFAHP